MPNADDNVKVKAQAVIVLASQSATEIVNALLPHVDDVLRGKSQAAGVMAMLALATSIMSDPSCPADAELDPVAMELLRMFLARRHASAVPPINGPAAIS